MKRSRWTTPFLGGHAVRAGVILFALVAASVAVASAVMPSRGPGEPLVLDVPQVASATDSGITLAVRAAAFSGTGTYVELVAETSAVSGAAAVEFVAIPSEGLARSPIQAFGKADRSYLNGPAGTPVALRLTPVTLGGPYELLIEVVEIGFADGSQTRVNGTWRLELQTPADIAEILRTEKLQPDKDSTVSSGVGVQVLGAVRSRGETLVTIQFDYPVPADQVRPLGQPRLTVGRTTVEGVQIEEAAGGATATYTFPISTFGESATLEVGPFAIAGKDDSILRLDIAQVISRNHLQGEFGESAALEPWDVARSTGASASIVSVLFARTTSGGPADLLNVTFEGAYDTTTLDMFRIQLASGRTVQGVHMSNQFVKGPTGTYSGQATVVGFPITSLQDDLGGEVTLLVGNRFEVAEGDWTFALAPGD